MGIHDGHRARMKELLRKNGIDAFSDHTVLELLLYCSIPRGDVNPLAHELMNRFGTLAGVFEAPEEELLKVDGVGANTVYLIKLVPQIAKRYMVSRVYENSIINSTEDAGKFLVPRFHGELNEMVYLLSLDAKGKVLNCSLVGTGDVNSANVSIRKIVSTALKYNATSVILAHNHTSGMALPSGDDVNTTIELHEALRRVDVTLLDHLIIADDDFISLAANGVVQPRPMNTSYKIGGV